MARIKKTISIVLMMMLTFSILGDSFAFGNQLNDEAEQIDEEVVIKPFDVFLSQNIIHPEKNEIQIKLFNIEEGLTSAEMLFQNENGVELKSNLIVNQTGVELEGLIQVFQDNNSGTYKLKEVSTYDVYGQNKKYTGNLNNASETVQYIDFTNYSFEIKGTLDYKFNYDLDIKKLENSNKESYQITINFRDDFLVFQYIDVNYKNIDNIDNINNPWGSYQNAKLLKVGENTYSGILEFPLSCFPGEYYLESIMGMSPLGETEDSGYGSVFRIYNQDYKNEYNVNRDDFSTYNIIFDEGLGGVIPSFEVISFKDVYAPEDTLGLSFKLKDEKFKPESINLGFKSLENSEIYYNISMFRDMNTGLYKPQYNHTGHELRNGDYIIDSIWFQITDTDFYFNNSLFAHDKKGDFTSNEISFSIINSMNGFIPNNKISVTPNKATTSESISINFEYDNSVVTLNTVDLEYRYKIKKDDDIEQIKNVILTRVSENTFQATIIVEDYDIPSDYCLTSVILGFTDNKGFVYNSRIVDARKYPYNPESVELSSGDYSISGTTGDFDAPILTGIEIPEMIYVGEEIDVKILAEDTLSGINGGIVYILSDYGYEYSYDLKLKDGILVASLTVPDLSSDELVISRIVLEDKAGNVSQYYHPSYAPTYGEFNVINDLPLNYPVNVRVYEGKINISVDRSTVTPKESSTINITLENNDFYEIYAINAGYRNPEGYSQGISLYSSENGKYTSGLWTFYGEVSGLYELEYISLVTENGNLFIYHGTQGEKGTMDLSAGNYTVMNTQNDKLNPSLEGIKVEKKNLTEENLSQKVDVYVEDDISGVKEVTVTLYNETQNKSITESLSRKVNNYFSQRIYFDKGSVGSWDIAQVSIKDFADKISIYYNENLDIFNIENGIPYDFSEQSFRVNDGIIDLNAPEYLGSILKKQSIHMNDYFEYRIQVSDNSNLSGSVTLVLENENGSLVYLKKDQVFNGNDFVLRGLPAKTDGLDKEGTYKAKSINMSDSNGNWITISDARNDEYGDLKLDLSHLDLTIGEVLRNDLKGHFSEISASSNLIKGNENTNIKIVPGSSLNQILHISVFYDLGVADSSKSFVVNLKSNSSGEYIGVFYPLNWYGVFEPTMIRVVTQSGTFDYYSEKTPYGSNVLNLESLNIEVSPTNLEEEEPEVPIFDKNLLNNLSIQEGEYKYRDKVKIDFGFDFKSNNIDSIQIAYRLNGDYSYKWEIAYGPLHYSSVSKNDIAGLYEIDYISIRRGSSDTLVFNSKYYDNSNRETFAFDETFRIFKNKIDETPPIIQDIFSEFKIIEKGATEYFTVNVRDESALKGGTLRLVHEDGSSMNVRLAPDAFGNLRGAWFIEPSLSNGLWIPESIYVTDIYGNTSEVHDMRTDQWGSLEDLKDLSSGNVVVSKNYLTDSETPILKSVEIIEINDSKYAKVTIEDESGISKLSLDYIHNDEVLSIYGPAYYYDGGYYINLGAYANQSEGLFELQSILLEDYHGNGIRYFDTTIKLAINKADLSNGDFQGVLNDKYNEILIEDVKLLEDNFESGDGVILQVKSNIDSNKYGWGHASFINVESGESFEIYLSEINAGMMEFRSFGKPVAPIGKYELNSIVLHEESEEYSLIIVNNTEYVYEHTNVHLYDFSEVFINISTDYEEEPYYAVVLDGVRVYKKNEAPSIITPVVNPGDTFVVEFMVESERTLGEVSIQFADDDYKRFSVGSNLSQIEDGLYRSEFVMNQFVNDSIYEIENIDFLFEDYTPAGNYRGDIIPYGFGDYSRELVVEGFGTDDTNPILMSVSVDKNDVSSDEFITYSFNIKDDLSGANMVDATLTGVFSGHKIHFGEYSEVNEFKATVNLNNAPTDVYVLSNVYVIDRAGNMSFYSNKNITEISYYNIKSDWDHVNINVNNVNENQDTSIKYTTYVQGKGWTPSVKDGNVSGTLGEGLRLEAIKVQVDNSVDLGVEYSTHIQNYGWLQNSANGAVSGRLGENLRMEAIRLNLTGEESVHYDIYYRVHAQNFGWLGWAKNGADAGTSGFGYRLEAIEIQLVKKGEGTELESEQPFIVKSTKPSIEYRTHVQSIGWQNFVRDGNMSGTSGQALRLEGLEAKVVGNDNLGIRYTTHVQNLGWLPYANNGVMSGTSGKALRLEALKMELTGTDKDKYDLYYRVHAQGYGWLDWAKNGMAAGTSGYAYRLEALEVIIIDKGSSAPGKTILPYRAKDESATVSYQTHVQNVGWQNYVGDGEMSGTSGQALRLEGIRIKLADYLPSGSIEYSTHVQSKGWLTKVKDGEMSGTSGEALRLEAIRINLTGELAEQYDIYYRVHAQNVGWLDWAKNGKDSGTAGYAYRLEGIEVKLVKKGEISPGPTSRPFLQK